ncbi:S-methyl-5'-thioadenosine phosphorylase [Candidatus Nitrosocosmicus franklandus]|uniref:Purine nucleoside phosphorylase n=2 Tax=Candidatus Nitrosocosmicus franklandianus TaxID=1798806 RepID=A0A484IBL3_9ARCH|nr:S-methyl-5'-thioadenosine phosphorylase [Candidatus Nitrosocosmicus franklandus]VFJ13050.1 S-methyl-5'-thioadenosine phosphorylase [Candidatus Nitrosocosmicus franklandus]
MMNSRDDSVQIAVIGGTGIYDTTLLKETRTIRPKTPYGDTSDEIIIGSFREKKVAFLPRHGKGHKLPPHMINYRANIWALKELGVKRIIAPSAVGSLNYEYKPGDILLPDQFIDFTKKRAYTFYDGPQVCHISVADPLCSDLRTLAKRCLSELNIRYHDKGTYICIEGPRFSTRAESKMYRDILHADIIGMTLVPECILARESEICYLSISTITDYDVWANQPVSSKEILETLHKNVETTKNLLSKMIPLVTEERVNCSCGNALNDALL